ncbi:MAG: tRNA (adenine-N1)-methyltransferase [Candidatus Hodarchaeota archaeon]
MNSELINENDLILLVLDERRKWLVKVKAGDQFHTHKGIIYFNDVIGKPYGSIIFSKPHETQGYKFYILRPLPSDYVHHMRRKTQIIYPEDAGLILIYTGIGPGSRVIEAGCGSGALTCILANYIRPNGHIYSYDINKSHINRAIKNIERTQLQEFVTIQYGDILNDDFDYREIDSVVLDMPQPWMAVEKVRSYLKLSGTLVSFSPTIEQVKKTTFSLKGNHFFDIKTFELIKREMQVKENATRPMTRMVGHTGYMTFARKIQKAKNSYRERIPVKKEFIDLDGMPLRG